ncbi:hypothetical protein BD311DRAFT_272156 [Dichomitus squalens]|uniref:Uncharacterized protein n=1 Tax=Dichomitus squalens TaxID=114155 RepID=A0A4Q9MSX2_9APHY|nr:hypothetical protein BD311DRAFT_272156 [Dichomitus squalens]
MRQTPRWQCCVRWSSNPARCCLRSWRRQPWHFRRPSAVHRVLVSSTVSLFQVRARSASIATTGSAVPAKAAPAPTARVPYCRGCSGQYNVLAMSVLTQPAPAHPIYDSYALHAQAAHHRMRGRLFLRSLPCNLTRPPSGIFWRLRHVSRWCRSCSPPPARGVEVTPSASFVQASGALWFGGCRKGPFAESEKDHISVPTEQLGSALSPEVGDSLDGAFGRLADAGPCDTQFPSQRVRAGRI